MSDKPRGYSTEFPVGEGAPHRYLLDNIPRALWDKVKAKSVETGQSVRSVLLRCLTTWVE